MRLIDSDSLMIRLEKHYKECESSYEKTQGDAWLYMMQAYSKAVKEVNESETVRTTDQ